MYMWPIFIDGVCMRLFVWSTCHAQPSWGYDCQCILANSPHQQCKSDDSSSHRRWTLQKLVSNYVEFSNSNVWLLPSDESACRSRFVSLSNSNQRWPCFATLPMLLYQDGSAVWSLCWCCIERQGLRTTLDWRYFINQHRFGLVAACTWNSCTAAKILWTIGWIVLFAETSWRSKKRFTRVFSITQDTSDALMLVYEEYYLGSIDRLLLVVHLTFDSEPVPGPWRVTSKSFKEPSQVRIGWVPGCGD